MTKRATGAVINPTANKSRRGDSTVGIDGREPVLDGIRGLAILAVLWHHFVIFSGISLDN